ncbi:hypothetical protein LguiB_005796 [Lonicera macranthoides]
MEPLTETRGYSGVGVVMGVLWKGVHSPVDHKCGPDSCHRSTVFWDRTGPNQKCSLDRIRPDTLNGPDLGTGVCSPAEGIGADGDSVVGEPGSKEGEEEKVEESEEQDTQSRFGFQLFFMWCLFFMFGWLIGILYDVDHMKFEKFTRISLFKIQECTTLEPVKLMYKVKILTISVKTYPISAFNKSYSESNIIFIN